MRLNERFIVPVSTAVSKLALNELPNCCYIFAVLRPSGSIYADFALRPVVNVDGFALCHQLIILNRRLGLIIDVFYHSCAHLLHFILTQQVVETAEGSCGHEGEGGFGKTYGLQQQFSGCRETVLWLAPGGKRVKTLGEKEGWPHAWTVAHFIGCHKKGGTWIFKEKLPDVPEGVATIIIDELYQLSLHQRERLLTRLLELGLRCYYTGDPGQGCIGQFASNVTIINDSLWDRLDGIINYFNVLKAYYAHALDNFEVKPKNIS